MLALVLVVLAVASAADTARPAPCPVLKFVPVHGASTPASSNSPIEGRPISVRGGPERAFSGRVGSHVVLLQGDQILSGSALDLLHPEAGWRPVPALDHGRWHVGGGLADEVVPVGSWLVSTWFRGLKPIRVAVYRPGQPRWSTPVSPAPADAWYAPNTPLEHYWIAWSTKPGAGFRFKPDGLEWLPMRASPQPELVEPGLNGTWGDRIHFCASAPGGKNGGGAVYDAQTDAWTKLPSKGAVAAVFCYVSPSGRTVALTRSPDGLGLEGRGAVLNAGASRWRPITGAEDVSDRQPTGVVGVGEYVVSFYNPGDPMYLLDLAAARWRPIPDPSGAPASRETLEPPSRTEPGPRRRGARNPEPVPPSDLQPAPGQITGPATADLGPLPPPPGGRPAPREAPAAQPQILLASGQTLFLGNPVCVGGACDATGHVGAADTIQFYDADADRWCAAPMPPGERDALGGSQGFITEQLAGNRLLLWETTSSVDGNTGGMPWTPERTRAVRRPSGGILHW